MLVVFYHSHKTENGSLSIFMTMILQNAHIFKWEACLNESPAGLKTKGKKINQNKKNHFGYIFSKVNKFQSQMQNRCL